ncbi:MAG: galactokinase [Isosphaeraceae bacterium]|nr:galactokinase [Isosphaeraceae bacterium]
MSSSGDLDALVRAEFGRTFGGAPTAMARAPARVELLGNHTDYNGGLVIAAAIDRYTEIAGRAVEGRLARVRSVQFSAGDEFAVDRIEPGADGSWGRYVRGVLWSLGERLNVRGGFEAAIAGDVPLGAGLSSSASLQAALAMFLIAAGVVEDPAVLDERPPCAGRADELRMALAQMLQRGENEFVGVASGLLDQFSVLFGKAGFALSLDCRSLEFARLSLGEPAPAIVVCDSKTSRRLADGMYNKRRAECERVVTYFGARWLRDIALEQLEQHWDRLDPVGRLRARHVLTENARVQRGADALRAGRLAEFGALMSASHASSRDDFDNSAPALDALIEAAEAAPGFLGGKLSGAGWAGCTVNLVETGRAGAFAATVSERFARRFGTVPDVHVCHAAAGATAWTATI